MKQRRKPTQKKSANQSSPRESVRLSRGKLWSFRLLAALGVPLTLLGLLELILRVSGYGYPTGFFKSAQHNGQEVLVQNNQFGWRFFGPQLARQPYPLAITREPAAGTIRVVVLGESAAKGDPDPNFGLPRMLEATLSLRHPGARFEVVNAAMTAINSHVILPIARDVAKVKSDVWVIYMGNNEVVGPFGAGTVFGPQTPPLAMIRGSLALKSTRAGQLLDATLDRFRAKPSETPEWGGMEMFLDQQVRADDPRLAGMYRHFERNLADIMRLGKRAGVGMVVSTVAVNLKDCAPFASAHRNGVAADELAKWQELFRQGSAAQESGRWLEAAKLLQDAAQLDDGFAELRFRQGQCALALGATTEALTHFQAARDRDTLRFRCDSRLNEIVRGTANGRESQRIRLADAERQLGKQSPDGVPGENSFYEHVHLNFTGNWRLARIIAEEVEQVLADRLATKATRTNWPTEMECARQLGWSEWSQLQGWQGVLPRLNAPPFTGQFDHRARMQAVEKTLTGLAEATRPAGLSNALRICESVVATRPEDAALQRQLASLRRAGGDTFGAITAARRAVELLPPDAEGWSQLGRLLARQREFAAAAAAFERAVELDPQDVTARESRAQALAALGKREKALREFQRVLAQRPRLGLAWLHLGQLHEQSGKPAKAGECYRKALTNPGQNLGGLIELAGFCQNRGWPEAAATNYLAALKLDPANAELHLGAGQNLASLNRLADAARHTGEAIRLAPGFAEAHLWHGLVLGRQGRLAEATEAFRIAVSLKPNLLDARINLGIAVMESNPREALGQFEEVLRQHPTHPTALKHAQRLRAQPPASKP